MSNINRNCESGLSTGTKRKKKRSANQRMKKLARRSHPGYGSELSAETYRYLVRILEIFRTEFATMDNKLMFVNNVFEQTIGNELAIAKNQVGSRVLDSLMDYALLNVIERLNEAFTPALRTICSDRFASHVLEKLITTCADRGNRISPQAKNPMEISVLPDDMATYNAIALKLSKYVINNIEEFVYDTYANHILRRVINCLGGLIKKGDHQTKKTNSNPPERVPVIDEYTQLLINAGNRLLHWGKFSEFGKDELSSGLLQAYLTALKDVDPNLTSSIIKKITSECFEPNTDDDVSTIFSCEPALRLLEGCLTSCSSETFGKLFKELFQGKLNELSQMDYANFAVQRLMDNCPTKEDFEVIFEEISQDLTEVLQSQNYGVFASLGNACLRLKVKQGPFISSMLNTLECNQPQERQLLIVPLLARLVTYDQLQFANLSKRPIPLNLHGSLIVQATLQFNKPIKIVNSIFSLSVEDLADFITDSRGSRILDAFMDSKFVGEKSRDKLAKMMKGQWTYLASDTYGSRCLEKIWQYSKDNQKLHIMEELAGARESLRSTKAGKIISAKLNVPLFARSKKDWTEAQGKQEKTKALFANLLGNDK